MALVDLLANQPLSIVPAHRIPVYHDDDGTFWFMAECMPMEEERCRCGARIFHATDYPRQAAALIHGSGETARAWAWVHLYFDPALPDRFLDEIHDRARAHPPEGGR